MEVVYERCCGVDVHKQTVVACLLTPGTLGKPTKEIRTFGTMTADLRQLAAWLSTADCTDVAMESTGVYWKPIYNLLESGFRLLLVNAQHMKQVPGRKSDVRDCEWIADLLRHGLLRGSFVPDRERRELRELTRYRTALIRERAAEVNRLQKTLEGANIKLASVASDVTGVSARAMLAGLLAGQTDTVALAELAQGSLRRRLRQLALALEGAFEAHQRFVVREQLAHVDSLQTAIARASAEIARRLRPLEDLLARLDTIPGVGRRTAEVLVAEIGTDMSHFPTAGHLASWAGLCPGMNESAGKRLSGKTRKGNKWLRAALVEAAQAAGHKPDTYVGAQYRRLVTRRGKKKATIAVAHTLLVIAYHLLQDGTVYQDLGATYFEERDRQRIERRLVARLERFGYTITPPPTTTHAAQRSDSQAVAGNWPRPSDDPVSPQAATA